MTEQVIQPQQPEIHPEQEPRQSDRTIVIVVTGILAAALFIVVLMWSIFVTSSSSPSVGVTHPTPVVSVSTPSVTPSIIPKEPGTAVLLPGARSIPQTFNNCGPATAAMALEYFGYIVSQEETKAKLRTNADDKNVFTYEIADYLRSDYGIESRLFYGGDVQRIKVLLANGFYILVEDWLHPDEDIGHDTLIRGFDDQKGVFIFDDSYLGNNYEIPYETFDQKQWKAFNREYLPLYQPEHEALLQAIVGDDWDKLRMYENAAQKALSEIELNQNDMYAWFNLGTSLAALEKNEEARDAFERSRALGWPGRMLWYQIQPVQVYNKLGEYQKALELIQIGLRGNDSFAELHYEAAISYQGLGQNDRAQAEAQKAQLLNPRLSNPLE